MQPNSASQQYPPAGYQEQRDPGVRPGFAPVPPQIGLVRVRAWLVGSVAALTMLVLIGGISNQGVADQIRKHSLDPSRFFDNVVQATTVYGWRFSSQFSADVGHIWIAGVIFDVLVVVLTLLITTALAKNKRGFGGTFLAAWVAAFVATQISSYVRASIIDLKQLQGQDASKPIIVFFSQYSPGPYSAFAGLLFGLPTALIAAAVASSTRRNEVLAAPSYPQAQQPEESLQRRDPQEREVWAAPPPPGPMSTPSPWTTPERDDRADLNKHDDGPQHTAVLPAVGAQDHPTGRQPEHDAQATTQFPSYGSSTQHSTQQPEGAARDTTQEPESTQAYRVPAEDRPQDEGDSTQAYRVRPEDER